MNRKGALFHWILFGAFLAMGIFVAFFVSPQLQQHVPGAWQQEFLQQAYFPAEAKILELDVAAREVGEQAVTALASNGGFIGNSPCGMAGEAQAWNKASQWCLPQPSENAAVLAKEMLLEKMPEKEFTTSYFKETLFFGIGNTETIRGDGWVYTFTNSFAVDMGYTFEQYRQLFSEAGQLVQQCQSKENLTDCVKKHTPSSWMIGACEDQWDGRGGKVPFCVSPELPRSPWGRQFGRALQYQFALDFTENAAESAVSIT